MSTFIARREALRTVERLGLEIVGLRSSEATMRMLDFARSNRLPFTWHERVPVDGVVPLARLPGGAELHGPSVGEVSRTLGIGRELARREEVDLLVVGGGPAGLGAAVYGASAGLETLVVESAVLGGQAGSSRRIENYLGFPAGITGTELTSRAVTRARKFGARPAPPYRAIALEPGDARHVVRLEEDHEIAAPRRAARDRRGVPAPLVRPISPTTRASAASTPPGLRKRGCAAPRAWASSAAATRRDRPPSGGRAEAHS